MIASTLDLEGLSIQEEALVRIEDSGPVAKIDLLGIDFPAARFNRDIAE